LTPRLDQVKTRDLSLTGGQTDSESRIYLGISNYARIIVESDSNTQLISCVEPDAFSNT